MVEAETVQRTTHLLQFRNADRGCPLL